MIVKALMFHHFHDDSYGYHESQGSISACTLANIINAIGVSNILSPEDFFNSRVDSDEGNVKWILTFDDGLKCQEVVALPILEKYGLKAFWFIHTMPLVSGRDYVESYRYFRNDHYQNVDLFYSDFFEFLTQESLLNVFDFRAENALNYLSEYKFYTENDRVYRYIRDVVCDKDMFYQIMDRFIDYKGFDVRAPNVELFMDKSDIYKLFSSGHEIGLHSHTHYTSMGSSSDEFQCDEYKFNYKFLSEVVDRPIRCVSYPCGSYNNYTLSLMKDMGIEIGFRSNESSLLSSRSGLELPRIDHVEFIKKMKI